jgi:hypothetical protein
MPISSLPNLFNAWAVVSLIFQPKPRTSQCNFRGSNLTMELYEQDRSVAFGRARSAWAEFVPLCRTSVAGASSFQTS